MHYAVGYAGHGVALATFVGARLADQICGDAGANPLADIPLPRAPLGLYAGDPWFLPLAGLWYRLKDWVG
jgi:glycine/D-amino acid oxidase-like deaminating enzyme